jgi:predicted ATPase
VLEERLPERASAHPELVASHYAQAGLAEKAIAYWDKAGRLAVQRSTMAEAAVHFGKALQLLSSLPKSTQRQSSELSLQLALAGTLMAAKGWASPKAGEAYARARELCRVACESFVAWTLLLLGQADQALAQSRGALAWARGLSQPYTLAFALHVNCIFHQLRGDRAVLEERAEELVALATEQGFPHFVGSGTCFRG